MRSVQAYNGPETGDSKGEAWRSPMRDGGPEHRDLWRSARTAPCQEMEYHNGVVTAPLQATWKTSDGSEIQAAEAQH